MAKRMLRLAMKHSDLVAGFEKSPGEVLPNKQRSTNHKNTHRWFASISPSAGILMLGILGTRSRVFPFGTVNQTI
jgi:hypothetical protein